MKIFLFWAMIVMPVCGLASYFLIQFVVYWVGRHADQFKENPVPHAYHLIQLLDQHETNLHWVVGGVFYIVPLLLLTILMLTKDMRRLLLTKK